VVTELFSANRAVTTVSSGGTDAPSGGTQETWTVASSTGFPAVSTGVSQFHIADAASSSASEIIAVTNVSGTTWTVTRGAESTTPVTHTAGFTIYQVVTTGFLGALPTSGTLAGSLAVGGALSTTPVTLTDGATIAVNAALSDVFRVTLGGNRTLANPTNPTDGQSITFEAIQDATGSRTLSYGTAYSFPAAVPQPVLSTAAGSHDFIGFIYDTTQSLWCCTGYVSAGNAGLVTIAQGGTGQVTQQAAINALTGSQVAGEYLRSNGTNAALSTIQGGDLPTATLPVDHGLLAWTYEIDAAGSGFQLIAGTVYLSKIPIRTALTATYLWFSTTAAGTGTSTGSYVGLYNSGGTLLTGSSDLGAGITAANHQVTLTTPQALSAGTFVWASIVTNQATAQPAVRSTYTYSGAITQNLNLTAANYRIAVNGVSQTSLPGTITPASNTNTGANPLWFGIS
jgi:hypothetical protein